MYFKNDAHKAKTNYFYFNGLCSLLSGPIVLFISFYYLKCSMTVFLIIWIATIATSVARFGEVLPHWQQNLKFIG